jgi:hypothetical protein
VLFPAGTINGTAFGAMPPLPALIYTDMTGNVLMDANGLPMGGSGAVNNTAAQPPANGFITTGGAMLVDIFGNPVVGP